jgi:hypothetical protein
MPSSNNMASDIVAPPGDPLDLQLQAQLQAHAAAAMGGPLNVPRTGPDGRPFQVRPCKYYPNCAKMDDPQHNAMYSHNTVVKKPPRPPSDMSNKPNAADIPPQNLQLCGFGEHCKRCGDEDHLDKYIHSCKFGQRCKKIDDPIHLKRFIHVLPGSIPPVPPVAFTPGARGPRGPANPLAAAAAAAAYGSYPAYPPPYAYPYGMPPPLPASTYPSPSPFPSSTHHSRAAAASYHPYGDRSGRGGDNKPEDTWANLAALAGYGQSSYADLRAAADAGYNAYAAYNTRNSGLPDGQYGHGHGL